MFSNYLENDNIKFVLVDDFNIHSFKGDYIAQPNCFVEVRIKRIFIDDFLRYIVNVLNKNNLSEFALTQREMEVLRFLVDGLDNQEIARMMNISVHTTKAHIHNIFTKLCVEGRTEAVVKAIKDHLIIL